VDSIIKKKLEKVKIFLAIIKKAKIKQIKN